MSAEPSTEASVEPAAEPAAESPFECPDTEAPEEFNELGWSESGAPPGGWMTRFSQHPQNSDIVWAGSQMNGLYKSIDGGERWYDVSPSSSHIFSQIALKPDDPDWVAVSNDRISYSEDGGESWSLLMSPSDPIMVQSMVWFQDMLYLIVMFLEQFTPQPTCPVLGLTTWGCSSASSQ